MGYIGNMHDHIRTLPPKRTSGNECLRIIFVHFALLYSSEPIAFIMKLTA